MLWRRGASEKYRPGSFEAEHLTVTPNTYGVMPDATQAPDGSIIVIAHKYSNYNSDPGSPPLQTGYTNIDLQTPSGYAWDGQTWYSRVRLQWAVSSSSTRSVSPLSNLSWPFRAYRCYVIRSNNGEGLTLTTSAVGSINFNGTKAPSTLLCLDMVQNKVTASPGLAPSLSSYTFDGDTSDNVDGGFGTNNGSQQIWLMYSQCSLLGGSLVSNTIEDVKDYYATGANTLSRTAGDMSNTYTFVVEAS